MRFRIINNKNIFGISKIRDNKSGILNGEQYRINKNDDTYEKLIFHRSTATEKDIFNIEFTNKHLEILESNDKTITEIFVRCVYDRYIKEIEDIQAREFYYKDCFKCDI